MAKKIQVKVIGLSLMAMFMLTACGQKLPLSLTEKPSTNNTTQDSQLPNESNEQGKN